MSLPSYRWVMLAMAFLITFTQHLLLFSYAPMIPRVILEMEMTNAQAFSIFSACILTLAIFRIPWGLLCDHAGIRISAGLAVTLMGVFGLLRGFAFDFWTLLVLQMFLGIGFSATMPCLPKIVAGWFRQESGFATGIYVAGFSIGNMCGLGLTPYMLKWLGDWRNVFYTYGVWAMLLAVLWWIIAREPRKSETKSRGRIGAAVSLKETFSAAIRIKEVWILAGLFLCTVGCYDTISTLLPYFFELRGMDPLTAGFIASMLPLGFLVASLSVGALSDWVGLRKPFMWSLGILSSLAILVVGIASDITLWAVTFIIGFSLMGILTLVLAIPTELPNATPYVASIVGILSSVGNAGTLVLPVATGYLKDVTGSFLPAIIMLATVEGATVIMGLVLRETGTKRH